MECLHGSVNLLYVSIKCVGYLANIRDSWLVIIIKF